MRKSTTTVDHALCRLLDCGCPSISVVAVCSWSFAFLVRVSLMSCPHPANSFLRQMKGRRGGVDATPAPLLLLVRLSRARLANSSNRSFFALAAARASGLTVDARRRRGTCGIVMELIIKCSIVVGMTLGNRRRYERSTLLTWGDATVSLTDSREALLHGLQLPTHRCPLAALLLQLVTALSWHCAGTRSPALPGLAQSTQRPSRCGC